MLDLVRGLLEKLELVIGVLLILLLSIIAVGIFIVAPAVLVYEYWREGDRLRAGLLGAFLASYVVIGVRDVRRREFGPASFFAALAVLAAVAWAASRLAL